MRRGARVDAATATLVERQMRNWELARSQRLSSPTRDRAVVEDFICLSRMVGIEEDYPRLLAERLGWPVFDKQILSAMAGDDHRMRGIYASLDERDVGWWEDVLNPLIRNGLRRNDYFHQLCRATLSLARQSPGVFVGRGLDRVLPADLGFRVQLVASLPERASRYARARAIRVGEAREEIAKVEAERSNFLERHYGVDATDPLRHDLTVKVDRLPPERAVDLILLARDSYRASSEQGP